MVFNNTTTNYKYLHSNKKKLCSHCVFGMWCCTPRFYKVSVELLHDKKCVSLAKFEGKDYEMEVLAHVANEEAFHGGIFYQLCSVMDTGLRIGDQNCNSNCLSAIISLPQVLWWQGAKLGLLVNTLLPLMVQHKGHVMWHCHLVPVVHEDTIQSVAKHWSMLKALFRICNFLNIYHILLNFNIDLDFKWGMPVTMCA